MGTRDALRTALALGLVAFADVSVHATHIDVSRDRPGLRPKIALNEGYLNYPATNNPRGEERTGWTDIRHPALRGVPDEKTGFDRSDHWVNVANVQVKGQNFDARPDILRDFDFANEIYAQAGLFVTESEKLKFQDNQDVNAPLDERERISIQTKDRSTDDKTVNNYYAGGIDGGLLGITRTPGRTGDSSGTMVNPAIAANDTFAHELGHFLLDTHVTRGEVISSHHPNATNLMAARTNDPSAATKEAAGAPREPGRPNPGANPIVGGKDRLTTAVSDRNPGVKLDGDGPEISQVEAIYKSNFVQRANHGATFADRADFDWVENNVDLSGIPGADDFPLIGDDPLVWQIGPIAPKTDHRGLDHDHDGWSELDLKAYAGQTFNVVDVVSQILRYADMDISPMTNGWSRRESALDYSVSFSFTGLGDWMKGTVTDVFVDGWTTGSMAEDYIARWKSPIDARYVSILALFDEGHDGNAQIDAVIAGNIPPEVGEPPPALLLMTGLIVALGFPGAARSAQPTHCGSGSSR